MYRECESIVRKSLPPSATCTENRGASIFICSLTELETHAQALRPSHLVSLVPDYEQPPTPRSVSARDHLRLEIDDIEEPLPGHILPEADHVADLIDFVEGWDRQRPILFHCAAGVSRSMAAALVAGIVASETNEFDLATALRAVAPHARPNRRMVVLADDLLGRRCRLISAVEAMGPAKEVIKGPLVRLPADLKEVMTTAQISVPST